MLLQNYSWYNLCLRLFERKLPEDKMLIQKFPLSVFNQTCLFYKAETEEGRSHTKTSNKTLPS